MSDTINLTVAGLGGQGVLKVTDILAEALFRSGFDVKKSEVHGMSQRGGSVSSEVRYGKSVASPMVPEGESDFLVILESTQTEVNRSKLKPNGFLLVPEDVPLEKLENAKAANIMLLGALSVHLPVLKEVFLDIIHASLPPKLHEINDRAFQLGREAARKK